MMCSRRYALNGRSDRRLHWPLPVGVHCTTPWDVAERGAAIAVSQPSYGWNRTSAGGGVQGREASVGPLCWFGGKGARPRVPISRTVLLPWRTSVWSTLRGPVR